MAKQKSISALPTATDAPLGIMVPKNLVPVVEWLWHEECRWL